MLIANCRLPVINCKLRTANCQLLLAFLFTLTATAQTERLQYHDIRTDGSGKILPWYNSDPGVSYDHVINLTWNFWDTMRRDYNGLPYYMNHQVWRQGYNDPRGLGGDQLQMALSSWQLLYAYTGNQRVKENMRFIADYYLTNGLSPSQAEWPGIPFPYNNVVYSGKYDGDMILGKGYIQPDKAGSLGFELVKLYKMVSREQYPTESSRLYLDAAIQIANVLAAHTVEGDNDNSPLPFKVDAMTGEVGVLKNNNRDNTTTSLSNYTTNWSGTLELFLELQELQVGQTAEYKQAFDLILAWMKQYPLQNNRWGPFFEDIPGWSDTQINATTFAQFIMNHTNLFPDWKNDVQKIFSWVYDRLSNDEWKRYGVTVINEQTAYKVPGNSHTSRQASAELQFMALTRDYSRLDHAIRQLNWATYMVDNDGKNRYLRDQVWLTDGYGDYIRHYLRAMAYMPSLSPSREDHILSSSSIIQMAEYAKPRGEEFYTYNLGIAGPRTIKVLYKTYDSQGYERIHLTQKPEQVILNNVVAKEVTSQTEEGYQWQPMQKGGGLLTVIRKNAQDVVITGNRQ